MAEAKMVDYYAILNLPPTADLTGIDNAYARLSAELAERTEIDETSADALRRVNEAYAVLSKPNLRIEYDSVFFKTELDRLQQVEETAERRRRLMANTIVGALVLLVAGEAVGLAYLLGWPI
ncbi:MAG: DnaJ domain-containing protein [Thermoflexaceae bacterium]|nr:DnaJ domain-containing protein [Thermoflexaceae bacterium]